MTFAHSIGKSYEYRVRDFLVAKGWKAERNPLSGASEQIEQELGKHDVRAWRDDLDIFLQIECKKTMIKKKNAAGQDDDSLGIEKKWIDKIDFTNDEFLVFSYNRCQQHFCFMPKEIAEKILAKTKLKCLPTHTPSGDKIFGFKREWIEGKQKEICVIEFLNRTWYALDLEEFLSARERYGGPTSASNFADKIKAMSDIKKLKELYSKEESTLTTKDKRIYYSKLERLESGNSNSYNPDFIKEGQWWMDDSKKFDFKDNIIDRLVSAFDDWLNGFLIEDKKSGRFYLNDDFDQAKLDRKLRTILGLDSKKKK